MFQMGGSSIPVSLTRKAHDLFVSISDFSSRDTNKKCARFPIKEQKAKTPLCLYFN